MNLCTAILFIHAVAVIVLTGALTLKAWILLQLRRTKRVSDVQPWIGTMQSIAITAITSLAVICVTGASLTESLHSLAYAWPRLAVLENRAFRCPRGDDWPPHAQFADTLQANT